MPKRKRSRSEEDDYYYLEKKIRKLQRKVRDSYREKHKRQRRSRRRSRTRSPTRSYTRSRSYSASSRDSRSRSPPLQRHDPEVLAVQEPESVNEASASDVIPSTSHDVDPGTDPVINTMLAQNTDAIVPAQNTDAIAPELDNTILEILGDDPTQIIKYGDEIQKDLAVRLEHWVTNGLSKEARKELKEKYLVPSNCKLINAPALNAEIKATMTEVIAKRDKSIEAKQAQLASAITALSQALTSLLSSTEKDADLIKLLMDTSKILCDCQYSDSIIRRNFVLSTLKKEIKDQLQSTKVDSYLLGENFAETIKTAKAINKSGAELKAAPASKMRSVVKKPTPGSSNKNLNWKSPFPTRRQPEGQRTKESAITKNRPFNSSRPSHHRAPRNSRR